MTSLQEDICWAKLLHRYRRLLKIVDRTDVWGVDASVAQEHLSLGYIGCQYGRHWQEKLSQASDRRLRQ